MPGRASFLFLFCWIAAAALNACNNIKPYSNCVVTKDPVIPVAITPGATLNLYLDSMMVLGISTPIDYHEKEQVLYVFDSYNKRLLEYPLTDTGKAIYPQNVHPLKVKGKISYFRYLSPDSLLLYTYGGARLLWYSLGNDAIYKELTFLNKGTRPPGAQPVPPFANAASPFFFTNNTIVGVGFLLGEKENDNPALRTICAAIDLPTGKASYHVPYPKPYWQHNWGGSHLRTPYATYNGQTKKLILSLPADHNIQLVDSNWQVKDIYAGTRKDLCITSMPLSRGDKRLLDAEFTLRYYAGIPSYRNIIYDHYHDRYYRILELPFREKSDNSKAASLIVFDKDFKYLGEAELPYGIVLDNFFVTAGGLYFLNALNKDQNMAQYIQCKIAL